MDKDFRQRQGPIFHEKSETEESDQDDFSSRMLSEQVAALNVNHRSSPEGVGDEASGAQDGSTGLRVCVVEDSYKNLRTIFNGLRKNGHEVDHFSSVEDAIVALASDQYDALIVSDTIAGGSAQCNALISRLRRDGGRNGNLPIIALAADSSDLVYRSSRQAGASEVLVKWTGDQLNDAIVKITGYSRQTHQRKSQPQSKRILLLEDSYQLSMLLTDALTHEGHDVNHVVTPDDLLALAKAARYDLFVISQNESESMNCAQLLKRLHALLQKMGADKPIIVLTSNTESSNIRSLRLMGADVVLKNNVAHLKQQILARLDQYLSNAVPSGGTAEEMPVLQRSVAADKATPSLDWEIDHSAVKSVTENFKDKAAIQTSIAKLTAKWRTLTAVAAALVLSVLAGLFGWEQFAEKRPVKVTTVQLGVMERTVDVAGWISSKRQMDLPSIQTGQLYRVFVNEGNFVRKGEKLATLDNREALINVRRAEAQMFRYRAEIDFADTSLRDFAKKNDQMISEQLVLDMKTSKLLAESKLRDAKQDLRVAQLAVGRLAIVAPFAGIAARSYAVEGSWVEAGTPLFTLADLDSLEVALQVPDSALASIQPGQVVRFDVDGVEWLEKIQSIVNDDAPRTGSDANKRKGVLAYATLGEEAPLRALDQQVAGEVITELKNNTIAVPSAAVFVHNGKDYVAIADRGRIRYAPINVGVRTPAKVEITRGLNPGDQLVLSGRALEEGQRVLPTLVTTPVSR